MARHDDQQESGEVSEVTSLDRDDSTEPIAPADATAATRTPSPAMPTRARPARTRLRDTDGPSLRTSPLARYRRSQQPPA